MLNIRQVLLNDNGTSDKVWGYFTYAETIYCFWGRRGEAKKLNFKDFGKISKTNGAETAYNFRQVSNVAMQKIAKGYRDITAIASDPNVYPNLESHIVNSVFLAKLTDSIR